MFQRRVLSALLLAGVVAMPALGQESATLEWKFEKDKKFYQTMATQTTQTMKVMGTDVKQEQQQTFFFEWTPTEVNKEKGEVKLKQKILGLKMSIDIGGIKISYDSTAKENPATANPLNKFFEALTDAEFTLTLDTKKMAVTEIKGHKEFIDKLGNANPQMKPLLEKILSEKALKEMAEPMFAALPGKKVTKGKEDATWKRATELDMGPIGKYSTTYNYTYEGPDKDKNEKIGLKVDLKYTPPEGNTAAGLPFRIKSADLSAKDATGTITYDPKAGQVKSSETNMTLSGNLNIEIGQQSTSVDLTQTQKTTITTSDKDPTKK